jgi:hypothetical protein
MIRVVAPGLPSWPSLWFDPQAKQAVVTARLATWRGCETAHRLTTILRWVWNCGIAAASILWLSRSIHPVLAGYVCLLGVAFTDGFTRRAMHAAFDGFFARQIFAVRVRVWLTPAAVAFRSRLYDRGVVVWRTWHGHPVKTLFDLCADSDAAAHREHVQQKGKRDNFDHLKSANLLRMVVATANAQHVASSSTQTNFLRSIPMFEIDLRDAQKFTMVLTAAASLTAGSPEHRPGRQQGVDIDTGADSHGHAGQ